MCVLNVKLCGVELLVFEGEEAGAVVVVEVDDAHFAQVHHRLFGLEARCVCQTGVSVEADAAVCAQVVEQGALAVGIAQHGCVLAA